MKIGSTIDYYVLVIFFFILIGIGIYFARKMKGGKDFFSGGNKLPWWVSGISLYMGSFSAWTFTGAAAFVYSTEWFGILYLLTWSIAFLIGSPITAGKWRRTRVISPVEYTQTRYNRTAQQVIGYVVVVNALFGLGLTLAAVAKVIAYSMGLPIEIVIIISGLAILIYTYLGGLWAVAVADVIQFIILIGITIVIFPLAIGLVGGFEGLFNKLNTIQLQHTFKGEEYNLIWIFALILFNVFNAGNQAQRYYSVRDEKSAKKVGILCGLLFLSVPILFGLPPLVAKILWPDLSAVPFFQNQVVPSESVFIAIVLQILPNGLIGVFMAAMFAATLSALDSAFNNTAAVMAKDLYGAIFKPNATDKQIMKFGRVATFIIGIITIFTAIIYSKSEFGLFNWMMTFVSLFNAPMTVPLVLGLLIKDLKRWAGFATILFGLMIGLVERFLLGFPFGFQMIGTVVFCALFLISSNSLGKLYKKNKLYPLIVSGFVTIILLVISNVLTFKALSSTESALVYLVTIIIGGFIYLFSWLFASETDEDEKVVSQFFEKLKKPIDLLEEVYSKGVKEISTFPIIGRLMILIGLLIALLALFNMTVNEIIITISLSLVLILVGFLMSYFGGQSEKKYNEKMQAELEKRGNG